MTTEGICDSLKELAQGKYSVVEGFCGPGGMSLGLENAGFVPTLAFDIDRMAVETHKRNLPGDCWEADASTLTGRKICRSLGIKKGELALFAGGPPCQGFSKQKRGAHLGDNRNNLILEFVRLVEELQPRFFAFENVAIFGQKRGKQYLRTMAETLSNYKIYPRFVNSADYGLAQTRERFIAVGRRRDQATRFSFPSPIVSEWKTVGDVLGKYPEPPEDYTDHPDFPNHQRARVTEINIRRFSYVPQGGGWQDIPYDHRLECHKKVDVSSGGWPDVYGRLKWDGQCPTITGGFDSFTRGRYGHPLQDRPLTPREAAAIQGFPDDFVFVGTRADWRRQIGNAVPPPLAAAVGAEILQSLLGADGEIDCEPEEDD
jgi:DNA (cytosine-5)-methyltransferase 1